MEIVTLAGILFVYQDCFYLRTFGNLLNVRKQRVQMFTVFVVPLISRRRRCTFNTKRRRVRCCENGTLLPYIGLRSQISQRPAAMTFSSLNLQRILDSTTWKRVGAIHPHVWGRGGTTHPHVCRVGSIPLCSLDYHRGL